MSAIETIAFDDPKALEKIVATWQEGRSICVPNPFLPTPKLPLEGVEGAGVILPTSGTTNEPKWVVHSLKGLIQNAKGVNPKIGLSEESRYWLSLPLYHIAGVAILVRCLLSGASCIQGEEIGSGFESFLKKEKISHLSFVPTQLRRAIKEEAPLHQLQAIMLGGEPHESVEGLPIFSSYGMSEMGSTITLNGEVLPYRQVKLFEGEVHVGGECLFKGYLKEGSVELPELKEGLFPTKDLGEFREGKLHILGRKDRCFFSGGENIHPEQIERAALSIEGVEKAICRPLPDPDLSMRAHLEVQSRRSLKEIEGELEKRLTRRYLPKSYAHI